MKGGTLKALKTAAAIFAAVIGLVVIWQVGKLMFVWGAWNLAYKDFQAVCTEPRELTGDDIDRFRVLAGPYTQEFWLSLNEAYDAFPSDFDPSWADWQDDGTLRVPFAFDFQPSEEDRTTYLRHDRRPRERSHVLASVAAYEMLERRIAIGTDLSSVAYLAYTHDAAIYPPRLRANTCGVMEELIQKEGALARE